MNKKYYEDLSKKEENKFRKEIRTSQKYFIEIINASSRLIFNWLFALNTGGLVALGTIYNKTGLFKNFSALLFFGGIILVMLAIESVKGFV